MENIKQLLEDYRRKLNTISKMIEELPHNCPDNHTRIRYRTKASCYSTFIVELERALKEE